MIEKYRGKIIQVIHTPTKVGDKMINFETARRAPGVRMIFRDIDNNGETKYLITKEYRHELDAYDHRLPGGKVFDSLKDYLEVTGDEEAILKAAEETVMREAREEVGLIPENFELIKISKNGATMEWDLYYFFIDKFTSNVAGQELEAGEDISISWYDKDQLLELATSGQIHEDRSVGVLLKTALA